MRAVLIKGPSLYEGTRTFVDCAAKALERAGHVADIVDLEQAADPWAPLIAAADCRPTDLVFSINIGGEPRHPTRGWLSQLFEAPQVVWHVDYLLGQSARLDGTPPTTALLVIDPSQAKGVRALWGADRFPHLDFCPHAAVGQAAPDDADAAEFCARRPIGILWCGSFQAPGERPWTSLDPPVRGLIDEAFDLSLSLEWIAPLEAIDAVLWSRGVEPKDPDFRGVRLAAAMLDAQVRTTRRLAFVEAVAETGLPVHICGQGWEGELGRFRHATCEGPVPMTRAVELMRSSRVVLNTNGNFGAGSHERPLSALLAGAAAFSDYSRFYDEAFEEDRDISLFRWRALPAAMDRLADLATRPDLALDTARRGKAKVLAAHTFDHRVQAIIAAAAKAGDGANAAAHAQRRA